MPRRTLIEFSATDIQFLNSYLDKWNNIPSTGKGGYSKKHAQMFLDTTTREFWIQHRGGKQYKPKVTLLVHKRIRNFFHNKCKERAGGKSKENNWEGPKVPEGTSDLAQVQSSSSSVLLDTKQCSVIIPQCVDVINKDQSVDNRQPLDLPHIMTIQEQLGAWLDDDDSDVDQLNQ